MALLNADSGEFVVVDTAAMDWEASPAAGVERRRLEVLSTETEQVTTIVRFAPGSYFPAHTHGGGEEYLVLAGTFSDESGDYHAGHYVRNPPGSQHQPFTRDGCTILVRLWQFAEGDQQAVSVDTRGAEWPHGPIPGRSYLPLHHYAGEEVKLLRLAANTTFPYHEHPGGEELLVLEGSFSDERGIYTQGCWTRAPVGSGHTPVTGEQGVLLYVRTGHLH